MRNIDKTLKTTIMLAAVSLFIFPLTAIAQEDGVVHIEVIQGEVAVEKNEAEGKEEKSDNSDEKSPEKDDGEESVYDIRTKVERAQKERLELLKLLGSIYKEIDRTDEATEMYKKALAIDPSDNELFKDVLEQYQKSGKWNELIPIYEQLIDKYKGENVEYYGKLIDLYVRTNQEEKTFETVEKYLNEHGDKEETYLFAANVYLLKDRNEDALKAIEAGLSKFSGSLNLNGKAAEVYMKTENYSKALEHLEAAKNLATRSDQKEDIERELMQLYEKADIIKEVISTKSAELKKIEGELKNLYVKQAKAKEEGSNPGDAVSVYKKLLLLAPNTPEGTLASKKIKELEIKNENK